MELQAIVRKLGNSLGVLFPANRADKLRLHEGDRVMLRVEKTDNPLAELFGKKHFSEPTERLLRRAREDIASKWSER